MPISVDDFFTSSPPPALAQTDTQVQSFISLALSKSLPVVLLTSGGTTVPLENQTVRFLDNFSAGTRGSISAEKFLDAGYAVIFLHREFSLLPYSRHYSHSTNCFLDYMTIGSDGSVGIDESWSAGMKDVLVKYQTAKHSQTLLMLSFTTVKDYLFSLRTITRALTPLGPSALFYLAAAVSDFFVPDQKLVEHKIQSEAEDEGLQLKLDKVPKILKPLVKEWAPEGFVVSFKLETDPGLLMNKAWKSMETYGHHIVIGNVLSSRKRQVVFVYADGTTKEIKLTDAQIAEGLEIESLIVPELARCHRHWIDKK